MDSMKVQEDEVMPKLVNPVYVEKVKKLSKAETERLLSRMSGKLPQRLEKDKLSRDEALALQMELEDEQLQEWRSRMAELNHKIEKQKLKDAEKAKQEAKSADKTKSPKKAKAIEKTEKTVKAVKAKRSTAKQKDAA